MRRGPDLGLPGRLITLLSCVDPTDDRRDVRIAADLCEQDGYTSAEIAAFAPTLESLLSDEAVTNADLKGLMNRAMGKAWGAPFELGPRAFLEAVARQLRAFE